MALYKDPSEMTRVDDPAFDKSYAPGSVTPSSGIYMCVNCRDEVAVNAGNPLPPQNHRQHSNRTLPIRWRLLIKTQSGPEPN